MKEFWNCVQLAFAIVGGWLGHFLGGCDGLLIALIIVTVLDYITGVMCAITDKRLSSEVGYKGIFRKIVIFMLIGVANVFDTSVLPGSGSVLRTAAIFFYLSNEGVSLLENASHLGLPVPKKIQDVLEQLHDRAESDDSVGAKAVHHEHTVIK